MTPKDEIVPLLKKLRRSGFLATLDLRVKEAVDQDLSHGEFLYRLLSDEIGRRESRRPLPAGPDRSRAGAVRRATAGSSGRCG